MGFRFNPLTGTLDLVGSGSSGSGITGPASSTDKAITRWNGVTGTVVQDSPGTLVQDSGAIQAQGFISNRIINGTVDVPDENTWITDTLEMQPSAIITLGQGSRIIIG